MDSKDPIGDRCWDYVMSTRYYECSDDFTLEELYEAIEARIMQSDKVYQHFAERFRREHVVYSGGMYPIAVITPAEDIDTNT